MKTDEELSKLWDKYENLKSKKASSNAIESARNKLANEYYPVVIEVARRMASKLNEVTAEECASYGVDGLYEAIDKFDRSLGNKFRTFAPHRIRGAILDNIRKVDWIPRLVRYRNNIVDKKKQSYYKENGFYPTDEEIADSLGYSIEQYRKISNKSIPINTCSINNNTVNIQDNDDLAHLDHISQDQESEPIDGILRDEMFKKLLGKDFTRLERKIVYLHYYEGLTMKEIAENTSFSESRISQMHAEILRRLKQKIARNPNYASDLEKLFETS